MKKNLLNYCLALCLSLSSMMGHVMASGPTTPVPNQTTGTAQTTQVVVKKVMTQEEAAEFAALDTGELNTVTAGVSNADLTLYVLVLILVILVV